MPAHEKHYGAKTYPRKEQISDGIATASFRTLEKFVASVEARAGAKKSEVESARAALEDVNNLILRARAVVNNWEKGDLAGSVRALDSSLIKL